MVSKKDAPRDENWCREEFLERFHRALAERPEVSDEEFLAETEVSDEQYALGLVLPVTLNRKGEPND